jgi:hypothetical protein
MITILIESMMKSENLTFKSEKFGKWYEKGHIKLNANFFRCKGKSSM